ncbi:TIR domain-containing protein [Mucilaginibacter sp.]|uniref:TIR domain-containing protein n=1 Tax=Mucilaginibacter sp. TaxID=1882438 RepID=UPI002ED350E2
MKPIKLFYSYSQKDEEYRDELEKSLIMLKRYNDLHEWHFRQISPGQEWDSEINQKLESADIILLLVSSDFLVSEYCYDIEVKKAVEMHETGQAIVVPVILRECDWKHENSPFKKLQALPKNGKPIKQWDDRDTAFNDVTQRLKETIQEIKKKKLIEQQVGNISTKVEDVILTEIKKKDERIDEKTLGEAFNLISQNIRKLDYDSSKEDFEEVQKLRDKIYNELIGKLDEKIENIPSLRDNLIFNLFDKVYTSEKLDSITTQDIQNIRERRETHKWYERKVLVNSLTLSLIASKVFDPKKVNILIDFLTDFEEGVWESALIGIVISLVYHQNKWNRFNDLKIRLQTLQEISKVQIGLSKIDTIFRYQLYSKNVFNPNIYKEDFFNSPLNCFLPFYEGNRVFEHALQKNNSNIDSDHFNEYLDVLPLLACHKYALCLALGNNSLTVKKLNNDEKKIIKDSLQLSANFEPYQNLICEYYNFLNFYPKITISDLFVNNISISRTKLKNVILNKKSELDLSASMLMDENEYKEAIGKLSQLLEIAPDNLAANSKIADCYLNLKKPDYISALRHFKKNHALNSKRIYDVRGIIRCYIALKNYNSALEFIEQAKIDFPFRKEVFLIQCDYYESIKDYYKVIEVSKLGLEKYKSDYTFTINIADAFLEIEDYSSSIKYYTKSMELATTKQLRFCYRGLAESYCFTKNFESSIDFAVKAYEQDSKDVWSLLCLGRMNMLSKRDFKLARKYLEAALNKITSPIIYGNLGHLEIFEGNISKAIDFYKKSIVGLNSEKDFSNKINRDLSFLLSCGVTEEKYMNIIKEVTSYYNGRNNLSQAS